MNIEDKSLKNELIYFKEEILKDMRFELSKFTTKIDNQRDSFNQMVSSLELKFSAISDKFIILSNSISEDKALKEKIKELNAFQNKTKDTLSFHDSKFKYHYKMIIDAMNRIDHFINESILYNDVIGPTRNCKFQNFHNFIDYIITNITQLNNFKEKTASNDIKSYKSKMDTSLESLRTQIFNTSKGNNNYAKKLVEKEEEKINGMFSLYDEKITGLRMENSKYISNIKMNFENMKRLYEICLREYIKSYDEKKTNETIANILSIIFFSACNVQGVIVMLENRDSVIMKNIEKDPKYKKVINNMEQSLEGIVEEIKKDFYSPEIIECIDDYIKELKNVKEWRDLADYYLALQYVYNIIDNGMEMQRKYKTGLDMLKAFSSAGNIYANNYMNNSFDALGISPQIVDEWRFW